MPGGNVFVWILIAFPLYLMMQGRLTTYLNLATTTGQALPQSGSATVGPAGSSPPAQPGNPVVSVTGTPGMQVTATVSAPHPPIGAQ